MSFFRGFLLGFATAGSSVALKEAENASTVLLKARRILAALGSGPMGYGFELVIDGV